MAEWSIAAVLKTVELRGSGGSNPSLSAKSCKSKDLQDFFHLISYVLCMRMTSYRLRVVS